MLWDYFTTPDSKPISRVFFMTDVNMTHLKLVVRLRKERVARIPSRRWKTRDVSIVPHRSPGTASSPSTQLPHYHTAPAIPPVDVTHYTRTGRLSVSAITDADALTAARPVRRGWAVKRPNCSRCGGGVPARAVT